MGEVRLQLLGPIELLCEGQPIVLGGPIVRQLFVQLALSPGAPVTHDRLVEVVRANCQIGRLATALALSTARAGLGPRRRRSHRSCGATSMNAASTTRPSTMAMRASCAGN